MSTGSLVFLCPMEYPHSPSSRGVAQECCLILYWVSRMQFIGKYSISLYWSILIHLTLIVKQVLECIFITLYIPFLMECITMRLWETRPVIWPFATSHKAREFACTIFTCLRYDGIRDRTPNLPNLKWALYFCIPFIYVIGRCRPFFSLFYTVTKKKHCP